MKILWLSNNPCYAIKKLSPDTPSGGWLQALNYHLVENQNIDLNVCFYWPHKLETFEFHNTNYYPIAPAKSKNISEKVITKISGHIANDDSNIKRINAIVNEVQPDLIHVHGTELNLGLIQFETTVPVVISIQGVLSPYLEKYFTGVPEKQLKKVKNTSLISSFKSPNNAFKLNAQREQKILRNAKYVIGRTDWDKRVTRILAPESTGITTSADLNKA
ncbi:MAG: hypothetical protein HRU26_06540, partial [Psychroserpens sp.]|nr:hypothetical protein [Psychroserpens sp.]